MPQKSYDLPSLTEILRDDPLYLDRAIDVFEASEITGMSVATLNTLRSRGGGPVFAKNSSRVTYTRRACLEWRNATQRRSTSDIPQAAA